MYDRQTTNSLIGRPQQPKTMHENACEVRAASPVEMDIGELRNQIDRLERLQESLIARLQTVMCPAPVGPGKEPQPYAGCAIGSQIHDAGLRISELCNRLDGCISSLQV